MKNNDIYMQIKENEKYIVWNPNNIVFNSANYVEILENDEGIEFVINCDDRTIDVLFFGIVPIYMRSEEGIRIVSWSTAQEKNKDKFYFSKWPIYKVENSCLIKGLNGIVWFLFRRYTYTLLYSNRTRNY